MSIGPNQETDRIATAPFAAIEAVDLDAVRAIYAPEVEIWHKVTNHTQRPAAAALGRFEKSACQRVRRS